MLRLVLIASVFILFSNGRVCASTSSVAAHSCSFIGEVIDTSLRKEKGRGISHGKTLSYIDVTIHITDGETKEDSDGKMGCKTTINTESVFQMHVSIWGLFSPSIPKKGRCIKAKSEFSADGNFKSGNWLTVLEELPSHNCSTNQPKK